MKIQKRRGEYHLRSLVERLQRAGRSEREIVDAVEGGRGATLPVALPSMYAFHLRRGDR